MIHKLTLPAIVKTVIPLIILFLSCTDKNVVTIETLLEEMTDKHSITYSPDPWYQLKQFSSYDRSSTGPDDDGWFANSDYSRFIREENNSGRREYVLFDHQSQGAIVRWWMTFAGEGSSDGIIRVYIDNDSIPVIEDNVLNVLSGQLLAGEPLSSSVSPDCEYYQRGHNLYLPIPYARACKITYECDAIRIEGTRVLPSIYYNINYRVYNNRTEVVSFSTGELERVVELISTTNQKLLGLTDDYKEVERARFNIEPGGQANHKLLQKKSAVCQIVFKLSADNLEQALRSTVIAASFDNNQTIWVPVGDFFGTGTMISPYNTLISSVTDGGVMTFNRVMPFKKNFELNIINYGEQNIECELGVSTEPYKWKSSTMYFGASWHEYRAIKAAGSEYVGGTGDHFDINFIDIKGKGVYAGDAVTVYNTADAWWGEGDEKIYVDNEPFPSSIGTGTEDYYGYAWCRPETFSHPFIAQPRGDGNFHPGLTINLRHRVLDAIPFMDNISSNIELWHWAPAVVNYALTSWWYVKPGYLTNHQPEPESVILQIANERSDLISPEVDETGILEGENLEIMYIGGGEVETQFISSWDWSNKGQLWWFNGEPGDTLMLRFKVNDLALYTVSGLLSMASDYGIVSFYFNNRHSLRFNGYTQGEAISEVSFGDIILIDGDNILTVIIEGKDPEAKEGFMVGIDQLKFEKTQ